MIKPISFFQVNHQSKQKPRYSYHFFLLGVYICLGCSPSTFAQTPPTQQEKPLAWFKAMLKDRRPAQRKKVVLALTKSQYPRAERYKILKPLLADPAPEVRIETLQALAEMGSYTRSSLSDYLIRLKDLNPDVRFEAIQTIVATQKASVKLRQAFTPILSDGFSKVRVAGFYALCSLKLIHPSLLVHIQKALSDKKWQVRLAAAYSAERLKKKALPILPSLVKALGDPEPSVRMSAAQTLAQLGSEVLPSLQKKLSEPTFLFKKNILHILGGVGKENPKALLLFRKVLQGKNKELQETAIAQIGLLGSKAAPLSKDLMVFLRSPNKAVQCASIWSLRQIGPEAIKEMRKHLYVDNWKIRYAMVKTLRKFGNKAMSTGPDLVNRLRDGAWQIRREAASFLLELGSAVFNTLETKLAKDIITSDLVEWLANASVDQQWQVQKIILQIFSHLPSKRIKTQQKWLAKTQKAKRKDLQQLATALLQKIKESSLK